MVSVIIPLYNKARYIRHTIASVLSQTTPQLDGGGGGIMHDNIEVIVIDDGSTDDGPAIVRQLAEQDARIRLLSQPNGGVSRARNSGIRASQGEWVAFLDADDTWDANYLTEMMALHHRHPECGILTCARHGRCIPQLPQETVIDDAAAWGIIYWTGTIVCRRALFDDAGLFREDISRGEDRDMWLRLGLRTTTAFLNRELAHYEEDAEGSLTATVPLDRECPYWEWYHLPTTHPDSLRRYATNQLIQLARAHLREGHRRTALRLLLRCRGTSDLRARASLLLHCILP